MGDYYRPNELRASSAAFAWGELVHTKYKTGCIRKILVQSRDVRPDIDEKYKIIGLQNEERHAARLTKEGRKFIREHEFNRPISNVPGINLSGHMDFLVHNGLTPAFVDELKSVSSKNVRRETIKNGNYSPENLAQLVTYMSEAKVANGRLIYTFYEQDTNNLNYYPTDERTFNVTIDDFGKIAVDLKPTQYHFNDVLAHQTLAARAIRDGTVGPRPYLWDMPFVSPCTYCPMKGACDKYDQGAIESTNAFVEYAKQLINGDPNERTESTSPDAAV